VSKTFFHPASFARLETFITDAPQSLLISGPSGVGLTTAAEYFGTQLGALVQTILPEKDEKVDLEKGVISVDSVRKIYGMAKTIETGRRVIVIDYAERMGTQAQNAFLKLLEEPGVNTHFILLTHELSKLLPTIRSRTQHLEMRPVSLEQSNEILDQLKVLDPQKRSQLLFIATGLPAELTRLSTNDKAFDSRVQVVRDARQFLQGSPYDRLVVAQSYKDNREKTLLLLGDAMKMIEKNISEGKSELLPELDKLLKTYERIEANGNIRLQLAASMV